MVAVSPIKWLKIQWRRHLAKKPRKEREYQFEDLRQKAKALNMMAAPRNALHTLNEEDDEEEGQRSRDLNDSNRKLLRAGQANYESDTNLEEVIQNQLDVNLMKNSILVANGKVESLRMTGEQNEDEIDDLTNTV